jgi:hypothetical protein
MDEGNLKKAFDGYYENKPRPSSATNTTHTVITELPKNFSQNLDQYSKKPQIDKDLFVEFFNVKLPSKGIFYSSKIDELSVEYLTTADEDILTTPTLIENNTVFDVLLRHKIKTPGFDIDELLMGDKNAILLSLRSSSYGSTYDVSVIDPMTGIAFPDKVDLTKLKYKEISIFPDENLLFSVEIPMRKKLVKFRLITDKEFRHVIRNAEAVKTTTNSPYTPILTMRLKASIVEIEGNRDRSYINKFVDAMPALDSLTIRRKIDEVTPDIDLNYTFTSPAGYTFQAPISLGPDFFFPKI